MFGLGLNKFGNDRRTHRQEIGGTWGGYTKYQNGLASGFVSSTLVATALGWRSVEAIAQGDMVLTFDNGMQPVRKVTRGVLWRTDDQCPKSLWPLKVPAGALGNLEDMILLPEQSVLVESDTADMLFDDPFAVLAATDLAGFRGIERIQPVSDVEVIQLQFDNDEVVFAASGALLYCPSLKVVNMADLIAARPESARYHSLSKDQSHILIESQRAEDAHAAALANQSRGSARHAYAA